MKLFRVETLLTRSAGQAAEFIRSGGIVAFPTETVYGLGANVFDEKAIEKIFEAKQRPADNPLIAHIGDLEQIGLLSAEVTAAAKKLIDAFFPGPLTVVLKKTAKVPLNATAGRDTVGIRMPRNEVASEFLIACGTPLVAPSANLSGRPSPTTWQAVYEDLNGHIDCILQGEATEIGLESTVVDCTGECPLILRLGAVALEQVREVVPETTMNMSGDDSPRSPGMKHRHYSPRAAVDIVANVAAIPKTDRSAFIGLNEPLISFDQIRILTNTAEYAHEVFEFFRECDRAGIETIYCEAVTDEGIGAALMDRLRRAAKG